MAYDRVRDAARLYWRYLTLSLHGQMQYRASFFLWSVAQFLGVGIEFLGIWALLNRFGQIRGWTLPDVAFRPNG